MLPHRFRKLKFKFLENLKEYANINGLIFKGTHFQAFSLLLTYLLTHQLARLTCDLAEF